MFAQTLSQYWWILLLRGVLALAFGLAAFLLPGVTLATLVEASRNPRNPSDHPHARRS